MRKAFSQTLAVATTFGASMASTAAAYHPFTGKHADASAVEHDSGSVSMRLGAKPAAGYSKHEAFVTKDGLFEQDSGYLGGMAESIFGKAERSEF